MATGLRIRNQGSGQIQIDSNYRNLQLIKSGTLDINTFIGGGDITYQRTDAGFLSSTLGNDYLHVLRLVNDTVGPNTFFTAAQQPNRYSVFASKANTNKTIEYYTFGYSPNEPVGPVGLRLHNPDQTVFYDSRRKGLRVIAAAAMPAVSSTPALIGQFSPGLKIGVALVNPRFYYRAPYPEICYMDSDALHMTSDNRVYASLRNMWYQNLGSSSRFPVGNTYMANQDATVLVVDLTELPLGFTA